MSQQKQHRSRSQTRIAFLSEDKAQSTYEEPVKINQERSHESRNLVQGDLVKLTLGGLIPADCVGRETDPSGHVPDDWRVLAGMDMLCSDKTGTPTQNIKTIESKFHGVRLPNRVLSSALLASKCIQDARIMNKMLKYKQEVHAAFDRHTPHLLAFGSCCQGDRVHCCDLLAQSWEYQGGCGSERACFFILRWGCREHFVSGCWHSSGRDLGRLPQGVLVIYFGSAASWRPYNVVWPHQGPVPHSWRLYGEPPAQCNDVALGTTKVCSGGL